MVGRKEKELTPTRAKHDSENSETRLRFPGFLSRITGPHSVDWYGSTYCTLQYSYHGNILVSWHRPKWVLSYNLSHFYPNTTTVSHR